LGAALVLQAAPVQAQGRADPPIDLSGTRELRIGTPVAQAISQFSLDPMSHDGEGNSCGFTSYDYPPLHVSILAVDGRIRRLRIEAEYDNIPEISYRTPEGLRLGSTLAEVRARFPNAEERVEENGGRTQIYAWSRVDQSGYLFEISPELGRVVALAVGDQSLRWYEDCI
jgi:hypothetical protein